MDGTFNAEVMQLAAHFKNQQVVLRKVKQHEFDAACQNNNNNKKKAPQEQPDKGISS